jgi:hypothetical protein
MFSDDNEASDTEYLDSDKEVTSSGMEDISDDNEASDTEYLDSDKEVTSSGMEDISIQCLPFILLMKKIDGATYK